MLKTVAALAAGAAFAFGAGANDPNDAWSHYDTFVLRKDQTQHVRILAHEREHLLAFRWTLFVNGGLVMHVKYDGHRFQPLLYRDFRRNAFRVDLFAKPDDASALRFETPYALLVFRKFDSRKRLATIELKIKSDEKSEVYYVKGK
ncbi:hypothetical protein [Hydrogenimonas sp.]